MTTGKGIDWFTCGNTANTSHYRTTVLSAWRNSSFKIAPTKESSSMAGFIIWPRFKCHLYSEEIHICSLWMLAYSQGKVEVKMSLRIFWGSNDKIYKKSPTQCLALYYSRSTSFLSSFYQRSIPKPGLLNTIQILDRHSYVTTKYRKKQPCFASHKKSLVGTTYFHTYSIRAAEGNNLCYRDAQLLLTKHSINDRMLYLPTTSVRCPV